MVAINVLYLPRDDRLRALVRTVLDFVEEVYRPELLAGIRFVSFDEDDGVDVERAKVIAGRERFHRVVEHERCRFKPKMPHFVLPHSDFTARYAWIPISNDYRAPLRMLDVVVHELTHLAFDRLPIDDKELLYRVFLREVDLAKIVAIIELPKRLIREINMKFLELVATYITDNYFKGLERTSKTPTHMTKISLVALGNMLALQGMQIPEFELELLATMNYKLARSDLVEFRKEIHGVFVKMIKKFPADVLESNRAKYEVLYRATPPHQ